MTEVKIERNWDSENPIKGIKWDKALTSAMKKYEAETMKKAVWKGKVTG